MPHMGVTQSNNIIYYIVMSFFSLAQAQSLFGSEREAVDYAYPGDVIGINNSGNFAIGDTLFTGNGRVAFPGKQQLFFLSFIYHRITKLQLKACIFFFPCRDTILLT